MQVINWIGLNTIPYINIPINNTNGLPVIEISFLFRNASKNDFTYQKEFRVIRNRHQTPISQKRFDSSSFGRYMPSP